MKKNTYPPLIILIDMLFVFLFILILNDSSVIDVTMTKEKLFKGAKIVHFNGNNYVDIQTGSRLSYSSPLIKCEQQKECIMARLKYNKKTPLYVLLPENVVEEISEISLISLEGNFCKKLKFYISDNGLISYQRLIVDNACLLKIDGFQEKYKHHKRNI